MEAQVERLAEYAWKKFQELDASKRFLIALAGVPGSGKTTVAAAIVTHLNALHHGDFAAKWPNSPTHKRGHSSSSHPDIALSLPLDGYHLTREQLSALPNPEEAHYRRGAAFTFNPNTYLSLIRQLRKPLEATTRTIRAPSFDHAKKDPIEDDIHIPPTARIIIVEGLYVALDRPGWREAADLMNEIWFVDVDLAIAKDRVAHRNFKAGLSPTLEEALDRTEKNDMRNAREILAERVPNVTQTIESINDDLWVAQEVGHQVGEESGSTPNKGVHGNAFVGMAPDSNGRRRHDSQAVEWDPNQHDNDTVPGSGPERPTGRTERMDSIAELAAAGGGC